MKYKVGDRVLLAGIEATVRLVNAKGNAYVATDTDQDTYNSKKVYAGQVFSVLDRRGKDNLGNKAKFIHQGKEC